MFARRRPAVASWSRSPRLALQLRSVVGRRVRPRLIVSLSAHRAASCRLSAPCRGPCGARRWSCYITSPYGRAESCFRSCLPCRFSHSSDGWVGLVQPRSGPARPARPSASRPVPSGAGSSAAAPLYATHLDELFLYRRSCASRETCAERDHVLYYSLKYPRQKSEIIRSNGRANPTGDRTRRSVTRHAAHAHAHAWHIFDTCIHRYGRYIGCFHGTIGILFHDE